MVQRSLSNRAIDESVDIMIEFRQIARDGVVTRVEEEQFEMTLKGHAGTCEEIDLRDKRIVHTFRTGEWESAWHDRLQKDLARCEGSQRACETIH
jgi:hypothetical protein